MKIAIIYASASGNTFFVAQHIKDAISELYEISLNRAEITSLSKVIEDGTTHIIFATSTWEHGEINPHFNKILKEMESLDLKDIRGAFVGTGDLRYEPILFCKGMEILREKAIHSGIVEIIAPLRINGDPFENMETVVKNWEDKLLIVLKDEAK